MTVGKFSTTFDDGIKIYKDEVETNYFVYGQTITVKVKPKATGIAPKTYALTPPAANQMALFVGTTQISDPVNADWSGVYTMTYDTTGKALTVGDNTITAKYVGNAFMADFSADVSVNLMRKLLSVATSGSFTYNRGNNVLPLFSKTFGLQGILGSDEVTALASGTVPDANVGTGKVFTAETVEMRGADKDFYALLLSDINYTVTIKKKLLTSDMMANVADVTYNGTQHQPTLSVMDGIPGIIKPSDYTVSYGENLNAGLGTVTITVTESGNYYGSTYQAFTIGKATPTVRLEAKTFNNAPFTYGKDIIFDVWVYGVSIPGTPFVEKPNGMVTIKAGEDTVIPELSFNDLGEYYDGQANFFFAGDHRFTAVYTPSTDGTGKNYVSVASAAVERTIAKADQKAFSIDEVTGQKYGDGEFALSTAGGSGNGAVTYSVPENNGVLLITAGNIATIIGAGTVTVTAIKAADNNYNGTTTTHNITIGKAATPTIVLPTASGITYGQKLSASTLNSGSTEYGNFSWNNESIVLSAGNDKPVTVTFTPSANTLKNCETITKTTDTIAITISKATPAITVNSVVSGIPESRTATLTATVTEVGDEDTPTGTVKFVDSTSGSDVEIAGVTAVAIADGKAIFEWTGLADQIYKVKAVYSGSSNYNTATSEEINFNTSKKNQDTLSISEIEAKTYGDSNFSLSANGGCGNGAVS